ncbi:MAG TPA: AMP-binding protein [Anaerolineales bacterium]
MDNFSKILYRSYQDDPDRIALYLLFNRQPEQPISMRHLIEGAAGYACSLEQAGIQPGEVVVLILQHGESLAYAFFGAVLRGAIPAIMPFLTEKLSPERYRDSLKSLFEITSPAAAITDRESLAEVQAAARTDQASSIRAILTADEIAPLKEADPAASPEAFAGLERSPDETVLLQHSSGTTGLQKGVALSHQAVFNQLKNYRSALRLASSDVIVSWLPLYHDMGLIAGFLLPILSQVPLVLMSPFDWVRAPYRLLQAASHYRGTLCWLPNFAYNFCAQKIRERDLEGVDLSSLRAVINCSEPMHWKSHEMFLERFQPYGLQAQALATCYAMAENVFAVTQGGLDGPVAVDAIDQQALLSRQRAEPASDPETAVRMLSAGRPLANVQLQIFDDQVRPLPERCIGEIALSSDCMLTGYYHRPDQTRKAFHGGWYLTGDLGYLAGGELYVTGRKKDLIIVGGKNIYPQDLERLACEVDGVHPGRVVAFGVFNDYTGTEDVVLVAESDEDPTGQPETAERIAAEIRQRVTRGSDIALRYVQIVERNWLLKTSSGKVARSANREKYINEFKKTTAV